MRTIVPCKECHEHPCTCNNTEKCACGGYMNDWHTHASDCIEINSAFGKDYNKPDKNKNAEIARDIRELCEEVKKYINEGEDLQEVMECVRIIKSMTWYIKE